MVKIIKEAHREYIVESNLEYRYRDDPDSGFAFPWRNGAVQLNPQSEENYKWCQEHPDEIECLGVVKITTSHWVPSLAKCECGEKFYLDGSYYGSNQCPQCGRWYNIWGQEIRSPDQWEEDFY